MVNKKETVILDLDYLKLDEKTRKFTLAFMDYLVNHYNVILTAYNLPVFAKGGELFEDRYKREFDGWLLHTLANGKLDELSKDNKLFFITNKLENTNRKNVFILKPEKVFSSFMKDIKDNYIKYNYKKPLDDLVKNKEEFKRFRKHFEPK